MPVVSIGESYGGPADDKSTLCLGLKTVNQGITDGYPWSGEKPVVSVVVPGHGYKLGQVMRRFPAGTQSIEDVFGGRKR